MPTNQEDSPEHDLTYSSHAILPQKHLCVGEIQIFTSVSFSFSGGYWDPSSIIRFYRR